MERLFCLKDEDIALPFEMGAHPFHSCQNKPLLLYLPSLSFLCLFSCAKKEQKREEVGEEKNPKQFYPSENLTCLP